MFGRKRGVRESSAASAGVVEAAVYSVQGSFRGKGWEEVQLRQVDLKCVCPTSERASLATQEPSRPSPSRWPVHLSWPSLITSHPPHLLAAPCRMVTPTPGCSRVSATLILLAFPKHPLGVSQLAPLSHSTPGHFSASPSLFLPRARQQHHRGAHPPLSEQPYTSVPILKLTVRPFT